MRSDVELTLAAQSPMKCIQLLLPSSTFLFANFGLTLECHEVSMVSAIALPPMVFFVNSRALRMRHPVFTRGTLLAGTTVTP